MKFSIRDLLLVTVVVALALAWWVDHRQVTKRNRQVEDALRIMNWQVTEEGVLNTHFLPAPLPTSQTPAPIRLRTND